MACLMAALEIVQRASLRHDSMRLKFPRARNSCNLFPASGARLSPAVLCIISQLGAPRFHATVSQRHTVGIPRSESSRLQPRRVCFHIAAWKLSWYSTFQVRYDLHGVVGLISSLAASGRIPPEHLYLVPFLPRAFSAFHSFKFLQDSTVLVLSIGILLFLYF